MRSLGRTKAALATDLRGGNLLTFRIQSDEGHVAPNVLVPQLATVGNGVAGFRATLAVLVVAVIVPGDLHHNGVLPSPRDSAGLGEREREEEGLEVTLGGKTPLATQEGRRPAGLLYRLHARVFGSQNTKAMWFHLRNAPLCFRGRVCL